MEATEMCINKWMDQEVHVYSGTLLSHKWIKSFFGWRSAMTQFINELVCCQSGEQTVLSQFGSGETSQGSEFSLWTPRKKQTEAEVKDQLTAHISEIRYSEIDWFVFHMYVVYTHTYLIGIFQVPTRLWRPAKYDDVWARKIVYNHPDILELCRAQE